MTIVEKSPCCIMSGDSRGIDPEERWPKKFPEEKIDVEEKKKERKKEKMDKVVIKRAKEKKKKDETGSYRSDDQSRVRLVVRLLCGQSIAIT